MSSKQRFTDKQQMATQEFEKPMPNRSTEFYIMRLYIAGMTPRSTLAVERVRSICERHLSGRYELTVVDLFLQPEEARRAQIVVAPTLIKQAPSPMRLFIGDMADEKKILMGLNIVAEPQTATEKPS